MPRAVAEYALATTAVGEVFVTVDCWTKNGVCCNRLLLYACCHALLGGNARSLGGAGSARVRRAYAGARSAATTRPARWEHVLPHSFDSTYLPHALAEKTVECFRKQGGS